MKRPKPNISIDNGIVTKSLLNPKNKYKNDRFQNEISIMLEFNGVKGVMPILEYDRSIQKLWFKMPEAKVFNIDYIKENKLGSDKIIEYFIGFCDALIKLYEKGYYHLDIKPDNLYILDGMPTIGDFGISFDPENPIEIQKGKKLGPYYFIAPEMLNMAHKADLSKADVYSLAKCLWCCLAGEEHPIPGEHSASFDFFWLSKILGDNKLTYLDYLLMLATRIDFNRRINLQEFREELLAMISKSTIENMDGIKLTELKQLIATEIEQSKEYANEIKQLANCEPKIIEILRTNTESFFIELKNQLGVGDYGYQARKLIELLEVFQDPYTISDQSAIFKISFSHKKHSAFHILLGYRHYSNGKIKIIKGFNYNFNGKDEYHCVEKSSEVYFPSAQFEELVAKFSNKLKEEFRSNFLKFKDRLDKV